MNTKDRVACIIANGFEDSEYAVPRKKLEEAGFEVEVIAVKAKARLTGEKGRTKATAAKSIDDAEVADYVALFIPGGRSPDALRADDRFVQFVRDFDAAHKIIAAVCHGPQLLLSADLVKGRTLTAWDTIRGDLEKAGAMVKDEEVVVDGNWITSRKPADLDAFSATLIEALGAAGDDTRPAGRATPIDEIQPAHDMMSEGSPAHQ